MTWSQIDAFRWVLRHPLNRGHQARAAARWITSQIRAQLLRQVRDVPFIDDTRLFVGPGLTVPNMQHYAGIGEMDVMGFLMHYLTPEDLFVDVGANVGVITVLASGVAGARTCAFEPDPGSCTWVERNVALNRLADRVRLFPVALGDRGGTLRMTDTKGAANRALADGESDGQEVRCLTLDEALAGSVDGETPTVIKVDVEGFELPVMRGAARCLADPRLAAVILELRGHGRRFGHSEDELRSMMTGAGFTACTYDPQSRAILDPETAGRKVQDTIFLRDPAAAGARVGRAPPRRVIWGRTL